MIEFVEKLAVACLGKPALPPLHLNVRAGPSEALGIANVIQTLEEDTLILLNSQRNFHRAPARNND